MTGATLPISRSGEAIFELSDGVVASVSSLSEVTVRKVTALAHVRARQRIATLRSTVKLALRPSSTAAAVLQHPGVRLMAPPGSLLGDLTRHTTLC